MVDSEAFFDGRMTSLGIPQAVQATMRGFGWASMGSFAFSSTYQPGQPDDRNFCEGVLLRTLGANWEANTAVPRLRRLYFESHTISIADLRRRVEHTSDEAPVRLPVEERSARLRSLRRRVPGAGIEGPLEPSHRLVDTIVQFLEHGQLRYVHWSTCTSRTQEVQGVKSDQLDSLAVIIHDSSGALKMKRSEAGERADTTSDLLLLQALGRRAIAFDLAGVCPYEAMLSLSDRLMKEYMKSALEGYDKISLQQLERADRHCFNRMSELTSGGLTPSGGIFPLQAALNLAVSEHDFAFLLMQMPRSAAKARQAPITGSDERDGTGKGKKAVKAKEGKGGKEGKGVKGKLKKTVTRNSEGKNLCFGHQKEKGCPDATDGEACKRGLHLCWVRDCQEPHPGYKHVKH